MNDEILQVWQEWAKSRYSDEEIRRNIDNADRVNSQECAQSEAQVALAKIAYNEMILNRIINAKKTWGLAS
jgi:hypothetical protein